MQTFRKAKRKNMELKLSFQKYHIKYKNKNVLALIFCIYKENLFATIYVKKDFFTIKSYYIQGEVNSNGYPIHLSKKRFTKLSEAKDFCQAKFEKYFGRK